MAMWAISHSKSTFPARASKLLQGKNKAANSQIEVDLKYHSCTKPHDSPEIEVPYNLVITPMSTSTSEYVETVIHEN